MKQALLSGTKEHLKENMQPAVLYRPVLLATACFLTAAFVIVVVALYRGDTLLVVPITSPIPYIMVDPSFYLLEIISLVPIPADGNLPIPQV